MFFSFIIRRASARIGQRRRLASVAALALVAGGAPTTLRRYAERYRKIQTAFDPAAMEFLLDYSWPGNVRELEDAVERAVLMAQLDTVRPSDFGLRTGREGDSRLEDLSLEEVECLLDQESSGPLQGNVSQAASMLGLSRSGLYRRLSKYGL